MKLKQNRIDREYIIWRLADWKSRLNLLFEILREWAKDVGEVEILIKELPEAREDLMQKFDVDPETVPAMAMRFGKQRVSFVPLGLWVVGSNGRVNITTMKNQYMLVDFGGEDGEPSQWTIVNPAVRRQRIPLDQSLFFKLMRDEVLFQ